MSSTEYDRLSNSKDDWYCTQCCTSVLQLSNCLQAATSHTNSCLNSLDIPIVSNLNDCSMSPKPRYPNTLKCKSLNARSIVNKSLDSQAMILSENLDVVAITETFLDDNILDGELVDQSFTIFRRDRNRHGGGVMLVLISGIPAYRHYDLETNCELLWVELTTTLRNILVGVFYCPPNSGLKFKDILFSVADQCIPKVVLHRRKQTNWLSDETLKLIRKKKQLYKRVKRI